YVSETSSGNVVAGTNYNNTLVYQTQHYLTVESASGGSATAQVGNGLAGGSTWFTNGILVTLSASANLGYTFAGWVGTGPGSYTGGNATEAVTPSGSATELATFAVTIPPKTPVYTVGFDLARPVEAGTNWAITIGSTTYASTGSQLNVTGIPIGTLTAKVLVVYSPDGLSQYTPQNASVTVHVTASTAPVDVTFSTAYWVDISAVGPGTVSVGSSWVTSGQGVSILATPSADSVLTSWTGTGPGSFTGTGSFANVTTTAPITEVATFNTAAGPQTTTTGTNSPFLTSYAGVAVLAVVGLILGAVIGLLWGRGGGGTAGRPPSEAGDPPSEYSEGPGTPGGGAA
ncbi:MAG: hypothetical protein L3K03_09680, partial [Thermoplasmata archaeon]|nr:hypothetical protein [Thermoplasmata archaeon]